MPAPLILLVDDDEALSALLADRLHREGYDVHACGDVAQAQDRLSASVFDVILLDVMLPDRSGFELCAELRNRDIETPILMLTARDHVADRVTGLRMGADDYLAKPFEVPELLARIEALRRRRLRTSYPSPVLVEFGEVSVNFELRTVSRRGAPIELSRREFQMLTHLLRNRGRVVNREELLRCVWGYQALPDTRTIDVHMWQLRRKLETDPQRPRYLRTLRGIGYRFDLQ
jgi:two-component system, OmpR family, alkaline phosphatase synthesis response regulator PhoP